MLKVSRFLIFELSNVQSRIATTNFERKSVFSIDSKRLAKKGPKIRRQIDDTKYKRLREF